jgi:cytochrome c556
MRPIIKAIATGLILSPALLSLPLQGQETNDADRLADIVAARQGSMQQVDALIAELEIVVAGPEENGALRASQIAGLLASAFRAFPHLFPPASSADELAAAGAEVSTSAAPAIWQDFDSFYAMAQTAGERADAIFAARTLADIGPLTEQLRESCEECHAEFLFYDPFAAMGQETLPQGFE